MGADHEQRPAVPKLRRPLGGQARSAVGADHEQRPAVPKLRRPLGGQARRAVGAGMKLQRTPEAGLQLRGAAAWRRCSFSDCALVGDGVELMWQAWDAGDAAPTASATHATLGLAVDRLGRALRSVAGSGLESLPLAELAPPLTIAAPPRWTPLPAWAQAGCGPEPAPTALPLQPAALAAAAPDLLWVADAGADRVWRYELWGRRYLAPQTLPGRAVALAAAGDDAVIALLRRADGRALLSLLRACAAPRQLAELPAELDQPGGLALDAHGGAWLLRRAGSAQAEIQALGNPARPAPGLRIAVPGARAIAFGRALRDSPQGGPAEQRLFVARAPGQRWRVFALDGSEDREALAPGDDGGAIAALPDGRVAYLAMTAAGPALRWAAATRLARVRAGRVLSFRLDAEQARADWGRVRIEACLPANTRLLLRTWASDDDAPALDEAVRRPPANQPDLVLDAHSPPLPDRLELDALQAQPGRACVASPPSGLRPGAAGWRAPRAGHHWLESWTGAQGRFLWVEIELQGDGQRSPVLRAVEIEQPGHAWLRQLPRLFSAEAAAADFLRRYLAGPAQLLADLGQDADSRHRLLDPASSPAALLDWLAGLLGLALQPAWPEAARRQLLREAGAMAPRHGTPEVLRRIVEILAGAPVLLIEDFRLGAPGALGALDGAGAEARAGSVLGAGIRLGHARLDDGEIAVRANDSAAWRFTLLLRSDPEAEPLAMLRDAVERLKPAHTAFRLCTLASGLRVGRGLHLDLAAVVGPDSGLPQPVLGGVRLGRDGLLGRAEGPP